MHRISTAVAERNYIDSVCPLIRKALENGFHSLVPERGIRYSAFRVGQTFDYALTIEGMTKPTVAMLNIAKNDSAWSIYYPFTLSIGEPDLLYEFVRGNVFLIVATDIDMFSVVARERGFDFKMIDDPDYAFQLTELEPADSDPMTYKISHGFAARIAFDFMSWEWIVDNDRENISTYKRMAENASDA